ncbi:hypothetical protein MMPV_001034 [Pyropia vietnamensis]
MARPRRTPTATAVAGAAVAVVVAAAATLCFSPTGAAAQGTSTPPQKVTDAEASVAALTNRKAEILVNVADAARRFLNDESRCAPDRTCSCSQSSCAQAMPSTLTCTDRLGPGGRACQDLPGKVGSCTERKLDFSTAYVHVAPGLLDAEGRTSVPNLAEDICFTRPLDPVFASVAANDTGPWTYFASASGMIRLFPGAALQSGDDFTKCASYDPRLRPWYVVGSGGSKDFVILVDASAAMREPLEGGASRSNKTRSSEAFRFVTELMNTFQDNDAVGVVVYGLDSDTGVEVLGRERRGMAFASQSAQRGMLVRLETLNSSTSLANPGDALNAAFDLLEAEVRPGGMTTNCTRAIIMLSGSPAGATRCEADCAKAPPSQPCKCKADVLKLVSDRQAALAAKAGRSALIATITLGESADDSLMRQTSCLPRSQGVWTHVAAADENIITTLATFYRLLSSSQWSPSALNASSAVASRLYDDAGGFGRMTSLTLPVYGDRNRALLGLAGTDITLRELKAAASDSLEVVQRELNQRGPQCGVDTKAGKPLTLSGCEVQEARGDSHCAALADPERRAWETNRYDCWQGTQNTVYVQDEIFRTRADAAAWCRERLPNGTLAVIENPQDNALVASLLDEDGSWLGVSRTEGAQGAASWVSDRPAGAGADPVPGAGFRSWARDQPRAGEGLNCAMADRRGAYNNWMSSDCTRPKPSLCSFPLRHLPDTPHCAGMTLKLLERPEEVEGVVNEANPGPGQNSPECADKTGSLDPPPSCESLTSEPLCSIGSVEDQCTNFCCPGCSCRFRTAAKASAGGDGLSVGEIIGIVAGVGVGLAVLAGLALVAFRGRRGTVELPLPLPLDDDACIQYDALRDNSGQPPMDERQRY